MAKLDDRVPVWRTMLIFVVPLLVSSILQSASGTITNIYLARLIDVRAFAAGAVMLPLLYLLISLIVGVSSAASVLVGQAHGREDETGVKRVAGTALAFALATGILIGGGALLCSHAILLAVGTPPDVLPDALVYARVSFATLPVIFLFLTYTGLLRGLGDSRTPLVILAVSEVIFIGSTPLLILGLWGLPKLGVAGMPLANALAMLVGMIVQWTWLEVRGSPLAFGRIAVNLFPDRELLRQLVRIGIPTGVQMMVVSLAEVAVLVFVNRFGSQATAAFGAVNQLLTYIQFPANCIAGAAAVFGAQSIGGQRLDRVAAIARAAFGLNYALGGGAIALCYVFSRPLLSLFITQPATIDVAQKLMFIALWSYVIYGCTSALTGLMRANGTVLWPTVANVLAIWAIQVPVAWALSSGPLGLPGIWAAYPVAFGCAFLAVYAYYRRAWVPHLVRTAAPVSS
jgi:putative MATE family efflux protein